MERENSFSGNVYLSSLHHFDSIHWQDYKTLKYMNVKIIIALLLIAININAQSLVSKSNEIAVTLKGSGMPDTGALPQVTWITPKLEFTSTIGNKIDIKAIVEAPLPLKEISLAVGNSETGEVSATKKFT